MRKREEAEEGATGGGCSPRPGPGQDGAWRVGGGGDSEEAVWPGQSVGAGTMRVVSLTGFYQEGKAGPGGF